jgi:hypothetical protein
MMTYTLVVTARTFSFRVAADGIDLASVAGVPQNDMREYGESEEDDDWDGYLVENLSLAHPDEIRFETANRASGCE